MRKIIVIFTVLIFSCGYETPEKDKFPNLPHFPDIANSHFDIVKFPYRSYTYLGMANGHLYTLAQVDYDEMYGGKQHVIIYDEHLKILNEIPMQQDFINVKVAKNGNFYVQKGNGGPVKKYTYPNFEPIVIEKHPLSWSSIYKKHNEEIAHLEKRDTTFNLEQYMVCILNKKLDSIYEKKHPCYAKLKESSLLMFDNEEVWLDDYKMDFSAFENCNTIFLSDTETKNSTLQLFDDATLGNTSSGNHFAFGFYQYGLEYFDLVMGQDTLKFKYKSRYLDGKSIRDYKGFNTHQVILITEWEHKMYLIKRK